MNASLHVELNQTQYYPNDEVVIDIRLQANVKTAQITVEITELDTVLKAETFDVTVEEGVANLTSHWTIPAAYRFNGFGVDVRARAGEKSLASASTAFDVVEHWAQAPRYGFLATFHPTKSTAEMEAKLKWMKDCHLNVIQFYDWMYRHHELLPRQPLFKDIFGRELSLDIVKEHVEICRRYGMKPIGYGAMYGAEKDFVAEHPDWVAAPRSFQGRNSMLDEHEEYIQIMNISGDCPWRAYIVEQFALAMEQVGFAGIHIDQYGFPKSYYSIVDGDYQYKDMGDEFASFLDYTRETLGQDAALIFNAVNNWPIEKVAHKPQDAIYIEVWPPYETFNHLRHLILRAQELSGFSKQVILAAYIGPLNHKRITTREAGERAARLTAAAIFANGGFHLALGEGAAVLTDAYYPEYKELSPEFSQVIKDYYGVITRYSRYLYSPTLRDQSAVLTGGINGEVTLCRDGKQLTIGPDAKKDQIWSIVKEDSEYKILHLVNHAGIDTDQWNVPQTEDPVRFTDLQVEWLCDQDIEAIFYVNPDGGDLKAQELTFARVPHSRGELVQFTVPSLYYWSFVIIKLKQAR
jgi:dextranase